MTENANQKTKTHEGTIEKKTTPMPTTNKMEDQTPTTTSAVKRILFLLNTISFLISFPILFCVVWLLYARHGFCEHLLPLPELQTLVAVELIFLFVISNGVVLLRSRFVILGLIGVMVPLIVTLKMGLALIEANKLESKLIPGSIWLKRMVNDDNNWNTIQSCIYNTRTCQDLAVQSSMIKSYNFTRKHLSPIESGCCIPPSNCDMKCMNITYWENNAKAYSGPHDIDCDMWQNNVNKLCYNCYSCKKGFMNALRRKWYKLGVFLVVMTILLIVSHLLLFVVTMWDRYLS